MTPALDRIVLGMDFSIPARQAARWILDHLAPEGRLLLVHSLEIAEPPSFLRAFVPPNDSAHESARRGALVRLQELADSLNGADVHTALREGRPGDRIAAVAQETDADLVVVGEHGHRRGLADVLGSTAEQLVRAAACPVLLARNLPHEAPGSLLVPVDGAAGPTVAALAWARLLHERTGARIVLLHVVNHTLVGRMGTVSSTARKAELRDLLLSEAESWLKEQVTNSGLPPEHTETRVALGDPVAEILATVERERIDLVVMGSRGSGGVTRSIGSVARAVLRGIAGPILIVHPSDIPESPDEET
jgi:nucleotide-binding universal stress UspA family protein